MGIVAPHGTCVPRRKSTEPLKYEMPLSIMNSNENLM